MSKILLLFLSFFNLFFNDECLFNSEEKESFKLIFEENDEPELLYLNDNIKLTGINGSYLISFNSLEIFYQVNDAKIITHNDKVYFFYLSNGFFYYDTYNKTGTLISKKNQITDTKVTSFGMIKSEKDIYIFYNSTYGEYSDCYLYSFLEHKKKSLSNNKNEEIIDLIYYQNYLYLVLKKDAVTEGIFGNGGLDKGDVIAKFDTDFNLIKYIVLDHLEEDNIMGITINNGTILLEKENSIHLFTLNLESINSKDVGNNYLITSDDRGLLYVFYADKIAILNNISLSIIDEVVYPIDIVDIKSGDKYLKIKTSEKEYIGDVVDLRDFHSFKYLISDNSEYYDKACNSIYSIFGKAHLIRKNYSDYYNPGSFGLYDVNIIYETVGKINFSIDVKENIPLECNIRDNVIYPTGYRIMFNGNCSIDGNAVLSNYQLKDDGKHEIIISGNNVSQKYVINVDHNQLSFNNDSKLVIDNYEIIKKGEKFSHVFNLNRDIDIKDIEVEGLEYASFEIKDKQLTINFDGIRESGFYFVYIDYLTYEEKLNDDFSAMNRYYLNLEYWYYVEKEDVVISNTNYSEDMSFNFDLIDNDNEARYIEIELLGTSTNYIYKYPIGNSIISFTNIPNGDYELRSFLVYDKGKENLEKKFLFNYLVRINDDSEYGEIKVIQEDTRYIKVRIIPNSSFLKKSVSEISFNKEVIYTNETKDTKSIVLYSFVAMILSFGVGFFIRYIIIKIKNKSIL